jgi:hypothetical protein
MKQRAEDKMQDTKKVQFSIRQIHIRHRPAMTDSPERQDWLPIHHQTQDQNTLEKKPLAKIQ